MIILIDILCGLNKKSSTWQLLVLTLSGAKRPKAESQSNHATSATVAPAGGVSDIISDRAPTNEAER
jgi:hypothetical protein